MQNRIEQTTYVISTCEHAKNSHDLDALIEIGEQLAERGQLSDEGCALVSALVHALAESDSALRLASAELRLLNEVPANA